MTLPCPQRRPICHHAACANAAKPLNSFPTSPAPPYSPYRGPRKAWHGLTSLQPA